MARLTQYQLLWRRLRLRACSSASRLRSTKSGNASGERPSDGWYALTDEGLKIHEGDGPIIVADPAAAAGIDLDWLADPDLASVGESDFEEARRAYQARTFKAVYVLSGSVLEGVLTDAIERRLDEACKFLKSVRGDKAPKRKHFESWGLATYIECAEGIGLLSSDLIGTAGSVKNWRNAIHPERQIRKDVSIDLDRARLALAAVQAVIADVRSKQSRA